MSDIHVSEFHGAGVAWRATDYDTGAVAISEVSADDAIASLHLGESVAEKLSHWGDPYLGGDEAASLVAAMSDDYLSKAAIDRRFADQHGGTPCPECGAQVLSDHRDEHANWHGVLYAALTSLDEAVAEMSESAAERTMRLYNERQRR